MSSRESSRRSRQPRKNTFFGGMAILTVGIMVVKLIGMFYKIPLGNIIGEQGYADFNNAYSIYAVLLTISSAGLPMAVSKMVSEAATTQNEAQVQQIFSVSLKCFFAIGGVSFLFMFFGAEMLAEFMGDTLAAPSIRALSPAVIFVSGVAAFRGYFQGRGFMTPTAVSQIIEAFCKLVLGLSLAYWVMQMEFTTEHLAKYRKELDLDTLVGDELAIALQSTQASQAASGAIMGVTVGTALALCFLLVRYITGGYRRTRRRGEEVQTQGEIIKTLLTVAIPITISASLASTLNLIDGALVQRQLQDALQMTENESRTIYGYYSWALNIYNLPNSLVTAVTVSVIPAVSGALAKRERKKAAVIAISALRMTALLSMPMGVGLFVMGEPIIALLYPSADIAMTGRLLSSLGMAASLGCMSLVCTVILQVYGFFYLPIMITIVGGCIKVLCNFMLVGVPTIGIYGAPLGYFLCFAFCFLASLSVLRCIVPGMNKQLALFLKPAFASSVMGGAAWVVYEVLENVLTSGEEMLSRSGNAVATLGAIGVAAVIYLVLILLIGGVSKDDVLMMPKGEKLVKILKIRR